MLAAVNTAASPVQQNRGVLAFEQATVSDLTRNAATMTLDIRLQGGELILIEIADPARAALLADAAVGLVMPSRGRIRFLGIDWAQLGSAPERAARLRGQTGRLFGRGNWLEHLSMGENILLPAVHHGQQPLTELRDQAAALAKQLRLPGLPSGHPADYAPSDLQRAGCVRALLGSPALVLLEEPTENDPALLAPLLNALRGLRDRGTAIIWLTRNSQLIRDPSLPAERRLRLVGGRLLALTAR